MHKQYIMRREASIGYHLVMTIPPTCSLFVRVGHRTNATGGSRQAVHGLLHKTRRDN